MPLGEYIRNIVIYWIQVVIIYHLIITGQFMEVQVHIERRGGEM